MRAFFSYQTEDRHVAGEVCKIVEQLGTSTFMAHGDIDVSHEWQAVILKELRSAELFFAILSRRYCTSAYCLQESGVAIFRKPAMTIVPLRIEAGVNPPGFMAHIQARPIIPGKVDEDTVLAGIAKRNPSIVIDYLIGEFETSGSYRGAEWSFERLQPFLEIMPDDRIARILTAAAKNGQIAHASLCAKKYLPPLLASHGGLISESERSHLQEIFAQYK